MKKRKRSKHSESGSPCIPATHNGSCTHYISLLIFYTLQVNSSWSQDTKYSSSWSSSGSILPSDIQDRLTIKSQRDLNVTLEKGPRQPQCPLPSSTSMVSITNNNYYMGTEPFITVKTHRSMSCPLKPVEVNKIIIPCKNVHNIGPIQNISYTYIFMHGHSIIR